MISSVRHTRAPIVLGASLVQFTVIGGVFAYGVFFSALETELGWTRTVMSACSSLAFLIMGLLAISAGRLNDKFGPRRVLAVTGVIYGIGYAMLSLLTEPWQAIILFGMAIGIGMAAHDVVTLSTIARWFKHKRGRMTGVVKVGTALGQISVPLIAALLIASFGWRQSFLFMGLGAICLLLIAAWLIGHKPPVSNTIDSTTQVHQGLNFKAVRRTPQFWLFCAMQFMWFPSSMTIPVHIVIHAEDLGFDATAAAAVLSSVGALSILSRLVLGWSIDQIGGKRGYMICFSLLLISLLVLKQIDDPRFLFGFALLYGFAHGGFFTVVSPTLAEFFGMRAIGTVFGAVVFFGTLSGAAGPIVAGWIFDSQGSYDLAFSLLAVMAALGLLMIFLLKPVASLTKEKALAGTS
ncbi:MAG: MFS transporter [Granulosicoccus sp.]|nr:MFS transporter [Granulosicoccus sp.]